MPKMFKIFCISISFLFFQQDSLDFKKLQTKLLCKDFKQLMVNVREGRISPDSARRKFQHIVVHLKTLYPSSGDTLKTRIVFPIQGYNYRNIGGGGKGYIPKGFDLFDNRKKGSHPAHDIFIRDRNQDALDDRNQCTVDLLAVKDGVILATEANWQRGSEYRGGNFVWLYDPQQEGFFYYAHATMIDVEMGELVRAGEKIGEVGRTGFNAAKARSGTHLHFVYLQINRKTNLPLPVNTYRWLKEAANY